jgi:hypothetical protein
MFNFTPAPAIAGPAMTTTPAASRRMRPKAVAAVVALCVAVPGGMYAYDAAAGNNGDAPIHIAKKGSFDITEGS